MELPPGASPHEDARLGASFRPLPPSGLPVRVASSPRWRLRHLARLGREWLRARPRLRAAVRGVPGLIPLLAFVLSQRGLRSEVAYTRWARRVDRLDAAGRAAMERELALVPDRPRIAIVMPAYETPPELLRAAIASVRRQVWPDWELCIADDASPSDRLGAVVAEFADDPRIRFVRRERNGHISAATNTALDLVTADWVALMDHDDLLAEHALYRVGMHILAHPEVEVIFTDEDKVDHRGRRSGVYHKPGFDPDLLMGQNLVSHLGVYRRSLIEAAGRLREGFEGSQDHDLILRVSRLAAPGAIHHIPGALYHWRQAADGNRSFSEEALERCLAAARRALAEHVKAQGVPGAEILPAPGLELMHRVRYPLPEPAPRVTLLLEPGAEPGPLPGWPGLSVLPVTQGRGADQADDILVFLGAGCRPEGEEWLRELVTQAWRKGVGLAGGPVFSEDGDVLEAGWVMGGPSFAEPAYSALQAHESGHGGALRLVRRVSAVGGGGFALRREALAAVGGFDLTLPDPWRLLDLCARLRGAGLAVLCCPQAAVRRAAPATTCAPAAPPPDLATLLRARHGRLVTQEAHFSPLLEPATGLPRLGCAGGGALQARIHAISPPS